MTNVSSETIAMRPNDDHPMRHVLRLQAHLTNVDDLGVDDVSALFAVPAILVILAVARPLTKNPAVGELLTSPAGFFVGSGRSEPGTLKRPARGSACR